jgi:hypothetical protein
MNQENEKITINRITEIKNFFNAYLLAKVGIRNFSPQYCRLSVWLHNCRPKKSCETAVADLQN